MSRDAASTSYAVCRRVTAPSRSSAQWAPAPPYGMPTLPGLTTTRRSTRRRNGMWVCPHTMVRTSSLTAANASCHRSHAGVDQEHLLVVARGAVAEQHPPEAADRQGHRVRQPLQQRDVRRAELGGRPGRDRVVEVQVDATGQRHQLPVGVAAHHHGALAEAEHPVQHLPGLRAGGVVTGEDDQVGSPHLRLRQHRVQRRQHAVHVREHRD